MAKKKTAKKTAIRKADKPLVELYLVTVFGCVEPELHGPFNSDEERLEEARNWAGDDDDMVFALDIENGKPSVSAFTEAEIRGEIDEGDLQ